MHLEDSLLQSRTHDCVDFRDFSKNVKALLRDALAALRARESVRGLIFVEAEQAPVRRGEDAGPSGAEQSACLPVASALREAFAQADRDIDSDARCVRMRSKQLGKTSVNMQRVFGAVRRETRRNPSGPASIHTEY